MVFIIFLKPQLKVQDSTRFQRDNFSDGRCGKYLLLMIYMQILGRLCQCILQSG